MFPDVVKQPPLTAVIRGLTSALSTIDRELMVYRSSMSSEEVMEKESERNALIDKIKELTLDKKNRTLTIPPPGTATAESTKIKIPGF